jgi:hypothetical protein
VIKYSIIRLGAKQIENLEKAEAANEPVEQKRET